MNITIRSLTEANAADFFDFFDNRAFSDGSSYAPCYCSCFQLEAEEEAYVMEKRAAELGGGETGLAAALRESAAEMIARGDLRGYMAYDGEQAVGWCNANDRQSYRRAGADEDYAIISAEPGIVKSVVCFAVAPGYRGSGIAKHLLKQAERDARQEGYRYMEVYPEADAAYSELKFCGPLEMYRNMGFEEVDRTAQTVVMRKKL